MLQVHDLQCKKNQGGTACECDCYLSRIPEGVTTQGGTNRAGQALDLEALEAFMVECVKHSPDMAEIEIAGEAWLLEIRRIRELEARTPAPEAVKLVEARIDMINEKCGEMCKVFDALGFRMHPLDDADPLGGGLPERVRWAKKEIEKLRTALSQPLPAAADTNQKDPEPDRRFDTDYPIGSAGFEILHCKTIEYRKMWLDNFKEEILSQGAEPAIGVREAQISFVIERLDRGEIIQADAATALAGWLRAALQSPPNPKGREQEEQPTEAELWAAYDQVQEMNAAKERIEEA